MRVWVVALLGSHGARALAPSGGATPSFAAFLSDQQASIVAELEALDGGGAAFGADAWARDDGSRGLTRVIEGGDVIEKGCVSTSFIEGTLTRERAAAMTARGRAGVDAAGGQRFRAEALSLVLHARSPRVPTLRGDARRFVVLDDDGAAPRASWFGGGCDLTPAYLDDGDAAAFNAYWRGVCEARRPGSHAGLKRACDERPPVSTSTSIRTQRGAISREILLHPRDLMLSTPVSKESSPEQTAI